MSEANMDMAMDINSIPLEQVDVSNPSIFESDTWQPWFCLLYTSPSPRDLSTSRMPSSA